MKIAVIGGGGVRSMFLAKSLAQSSLELGINQVIFMDNDPKKLNIYGKMAQQVAKRLQPDLQLELTGDPVEAIKDADYIITTIRVGEAESGGSGAGNYRCGRVFFCYAFCAGSGKIL